MLRQNGFTLIELFITLTLAIIIVLMAVSSLQSLSIQSEGQLVSSDLMRALQFARQDSLRLNTTTIQKPLATDWNKGFTLSVDDIIQKIFYLHLKYGALQWRSFSNSNQIRFNSSGETLDNGTFWYCGHTEKNPRFAIILSQSGRVRLSKPDASGEIKDSRGKNLSC